MNWFKRMVINWVREDWEKASRQEDCYPVPAGLRGITTVSSRDISTDPTLQFKVYSAVGGKIVEFSRYDRKTDNSEHAIYIIGKYEDYVEKISKISTLEVLR